MKSDQVRTNWRDVLDHVRSGGTVIVEHYNRPVARITPPETAMTEHFTAWLTTDTSALAGDNADVVVLADELRGEPDDPNAWSSTSDERFSAVTTVNAAEGDIEDAIREANDLLAAAGWSRVGEWESVTTGCIVTVERAASGE